MGIFQGQKPIEEIEYYIIKQAILTLQTVSKSFNFLPDSNERFEVLRQLTHIRKYMKRIRANGKITGL